MKTEFTEVSDTRKNLSFEIPPDVLDAEIDRVAQGYSRTARVPGFRPGKVPASVVKQRYADQILHDVAHDLIPRLVGDALRERGLEPVATPDIRDVVLEEGQPLTFVADFETLPPIDPGDYTGLTLRKPPAVLEVGAVDRALEQLRQRAARWHPVEDRPAGSRRHAAARSGAHAAHGLDSRLPGEATVADRSDDKPELMQNVSIELGDQGQSAGVRHAALGHERRRDAIVHGHLPAGLRGAGAGRRDGGLRRDDQGHPAQGAAAARRRLREGSERRSRRSTRCGTACARTCRKAPSTTRSTRCGTSCCRRSPAASRPRRTCSSIRRSSGGSRSSSAG